MLMCLFVIFSCADSKDRQDRANKTLVNVKAGIEHLADKLQHLKAVRTQKNSSKLKVPCKRTSAKSEFKKRVCPVSFLDLFVNN